MAQDTIYHWVFLALSATLDTVHMPEEKRTAILSLFPDMFRIYFTGESE